MSSWKVVAIDNFRGPGDDDIATVGIYETFEHAEEVARRLVRDGLLDQVGLAASVLDLRSRFSTFGETPVIWAFESSESSSFDGRKYAEVIARDVFQDHHKTDLHPMLRQAYRDAEYIVRFPSGTTVIRVGAANGEVEEWLSGLSLRSAAFFTAENPDSRRSSDEENAERRAQLESYVASNGWAAVAGAGQSPGGDWSEESLLIGGISDADATLLARKFGQAGFIWIERGQVAALRIRTTADAWVEDDDLN